MELARARDDKERATQDLNVRISSLTADLACAQSRVEGLTADLSRSEADADGKENVIKELTGIIMEKDRRIADLLAKPRKKAWWRRILPKGM